MKIVDLNILLNMLNRQSPDHKACLDWWRNSLANEEPIRLAWIVLVGFIRISTRPGAFDCPLTVVEAVEQVDGWLANPNIAVIYASEDHWQRMRGMLLQLGTGGNLTNDADLAALAIENHAVLVSCDTDFARFKSLRWENPASIT